MLNINSYFRMLSIWYLWLEQLTYASYLFHFHPCSYIVAKHAQELLLMDHKTSYKILKHYKHLAGHLRIITAHLAIVNQSCLVQSPEKMHTYNCSCIT